jgi:carboxypeptidase C (cathepsin A)
VDGFLAKPDVAAALGVTGITWQSCNRLINIGLVFAGDWMRDLTPLVPKILSTGVRIVVYAGEYDFVCNWYGNQAWMHAMQWPGQSAFINAKNTTWVVNQQEAGTARQAKGLTFLRVKDAGHVSGTLHTATQHTRTRRAYGR